MWIFLVFVNEWERLEYEKFEKILVCDRVGIFSDYFNGCRKMKMFCDLFPIRRGLY